MKHLILTLSLLLGLGTYASASDNAARILSDGKILKEYSRSFGYQSAKRRHVSTSTYIVAYKNGVYECLVHELMEAVQCVQYGDIGVLKK